MKKRLRSMGFRVFLDANVILDYVLKRDNYLQVRQLFELEQKSKLKFYMSSSIVHVIGYFLTKILGSVTAKVTIGKLLQTVQVVDGSHDTVVLALQSENPDIEDALQYEIALKNKISYFISSDKNFKKYSSDTLPIVDITDALTIFTK